ncbi:hypothetical protein VVD49_12720 [Uliginosibacterium sp. H3]|uniref:Pectate lyase domain-containing protein n=1 Tax=Uliginosibacterium silvisoli TaxID=3114758 RepID=A0ABU6K4L5_9RHOO|nr:hypothetical protein [Uliginosibacterium sp. H3]
MNMVRNRVCGAVALVLIGAAAARPAMALASTEADWRKTAPADGWASAEGGTSGGAAATAERVFRVKDIAGLRQALAGKDGAARIVVVEGTIDGTGGIPFASAEDQATRVQIRVPSNTTLVGLDKASGLVNANLVLKGVQNVIVRNLSIETPWDAYPVWDPKDGPTGHWNSEYDGVTIDDSRHVWVDHVLITDGRHTDDQNGTANGQEVQHHDGALDIKKASDYITVSWSVFRLHDKNNLIGHSDKESADAGHLRTTFHHNLFENVTQRAPRVRYGQVHLYNNVHIGSKTHAVYRYQYSHGLGVESSLISEANLFEIDGTKSVCDVVKSFGGTRYEDRGSLINGLPMDTQAACKDYGAGLQPAGWKPPYPYAPDKTEGLMAAVKAGAGPQ